MGENWQMPFNVGKCVLLLIGSKALASHLGYSFCGTPLQIVNSHPYLGIQLQSNLKWDSHNNQLLSNATQSLAMLCRVLRSADMPTKKNCICFNSTTRS